jgi:hypothetical protein
MRRMVIVRSPFVKVVRNVVSAGIGRGVFKVNDDVLSLAHSPSWTYPVMIGNTGRQVCIESEQIAILSVVVWRKRNQGRSHSREKTSPFPLPG